jgi:glucokinase
VRRYNTADYESMDAVLQAYFATMKARPIRIAIDMAGPRDDDTGEMRMTNAPWPVFSPNDATQTYEIPFSTANDMVATTVGMLQETSIDLLLLKSGKPTRTGTKVVVSLSTGIGVAAAVWDSRSSRYVILASEGGHIGFQPKNQSELRYLEYLHAKYPHASAELALSGKHGIDNLVNHALQDAQQLDITKAIERARHDDRPVGAVLLEYATVGNGTDKSFAQNVLSQMGAMIGSVLRDLAVTYKASGGLYLTGTVALALGEYLAKETELCERFVRRGAVHDSWLKDIPINLITDPNVAVVGALALAKDI